ncbi:MAG: UDP-N-acetylmuramate dehydrogenase [bacterium]|nr:UDP-N-acetylmuramate dehydrogenase [bacterium]
MFQKNIPLKKYTSFKIGGPADYFFKVRKIKNLIEAVKEAKQNKIPIFIFAGGTKILVSDKGIKGLVIKIQTSKIEIKKNRIISEAGVNLNKLVAASIKNGLTGLEWAIGIPGTIGGAIHGNSGAFGASISNSVKSVTALNPKNFKIKKYSGKQCRFGYRDSIFKKNKNIILSVELQLKQNKSKNNLETIRGYLKRRKERIPEYYSAGSVFKNLKFKSLNKDIQKIIPKNKIKGGMVPAGYLIENCGLKGKSSGGAKISEQQANIIINFNKAREKDVSSLIDLAKKQVKKKFGVKLEEEIIYLG